MRTFVFANRNIKELLRDPLNLAFTLGLPAFILLIITFMQRSLNIPNNSFEIQNFTPASVVFSFSFLTLFAGLLVSKDRTTSFLTRLFSSPLTATQYILGYTLPLLFMAILQNLLLFSVALILGLPFTFNLVFVLLFSVPVSILFIQLGLLLGTLCNDKQSSGITSILIQVVAFTSGMWFDLDLIGGAYKTLCYLLPFAHGVDLLKFALAGNIQAVWIPLLWVLGYAVFLTGLVIILFKRKMKQ